MILWILQIHSASVTNFILCLHHVMHIYTQGINLLW